MASNHDSWLDRVVLSQIAFEMFTALKLFTIGQVKAFICVNTERLKIEVEYQVVSIPHGRMLI
jgi:hypothetical protein